jgi:glucose-6-phosphate 1-dehydrogenase
MVQNHLLQILCLVAMEPMVSFDPHEIRDKKADVLRAIRTIPPDRMPALTVRGPYREPFLDGRHHPSYRAEPGVSPTSATETFVALKLDVDNWRLPDLASYLRTGKRLKHKMSDVCIQFRPVPHRSFPPKVTRRRDPNRLIVHRNIRGGDRRVQATEEPVFAVRRPPFVCYMVDGYSIMVPDDSYG